MIWQPVCRYLASEAAPLVRNFALVYVEMAMERSMGEQQMEQVGHGCCLPAQTYDPSASCERKVLASVCTGLLQAVQCALAIAVVCNAAASHSEIYVGRTCGATRFLRWVQVPKLLRGIAGQSPQHREMLLRMAFSGLVGLATMPRQDAVGNEETFAGV